MNDQAEAKAWLQAELGCDSAALTRLELLVAALREENLRQNLVAQASLEHVWWRHIVDSAQLLGVSRETRAAAGLWLDLGTGAGFPGLVVAALAPDRPVRLVEARRRRSIWLEQAVALLGLENVEVIGRPLERVASLAASVISARAFAPLPKLLRLAARFSTPHTVWLLPKGAGSRQEVEALPAQLRRMFHVEPSATSPAAAIVVGRGAVDPEGVPEC